MTEKTKRCSKCGEIKTLSEFGKNAAAKDGLQSWCRQCYAEYNAKRYIENREKELAKNAKWRAEHPEKHVAKSLRWEKANPEKHSAKNLAWAKNNPEKANAKTQRRRAFKVAAPGDHNAGDIKALYDAQEGRCAYCGRDVSQGYHVDHIVPLSRGGSNALGNLALTCARCNTSKGAKLLSEWTARPSRSRT